MVNSINTHYLVTTFIFSDPQPIGSDKKYEFCDVIIITSCLFRGNVIIQFLWPPVSR